MQNRTAPPAPKCKQLANSPVLSRRVSMHMCTMWMQLPKLWRVSAQEAYRKRLMHTCHLALAWPIASAAWKEELQQTVPHSDSGCLHLHYSASPMAYCCWSLARAFYSAALRSYWCQSMKCRTQARCVWIPTVICDTCKAHVSGACMVDLCQNEDQVWSVVHSMPVSRWLLYSCCRHYVPDRTKEELATHNSHEPSAPLAQ